MKTPARKSLWVLMFSFWLLGSGADPVQPLAVSFRAGNVAVLPCRWRPGVVGGASAPHLQWALAVGSPVLEQRGAVRWQAEDLGGRARVPEDLDSGDCSLIISDVQIGDSGRYESFMVLEGVRKTRTRTFIQSVTLNVNDHKSVVSQSPGEDLVLDLYTPHSVRLVFNARNCSDWLDLWMRGDGVAVGDGVGVAVGDERLEKHPTEEQLIMKTLRDSDAGTYKVLDENGLTVSTVTLFIEEKSTKSLQFSPRLNQELAASGSAPSSSRSSLFVSSLLVFAFQILLVL